MKRMIFSLAAGALLISLCGCADGGNAVLGSLADEIGSAVSGAVDELTSEPETNAPQGSKDAPQASENGEGAPVSGNAEETTAPEADGLPDDTFDNICDEYVTVEVYESEYGRIEYPVFSTVSLDAADAGAANEFFEFMRDSVLNNLKEYADGYDFNGELFNSGMTQADVECGLCADTVSALMSYTRYTAMGFFPYFKAVSFDIKTGKALDPHEVVSRGLYDESMAEEAVFGFAADCLRYQEDENMLIMCYLDGTLPTDKDLMPLFSSDIAQKAVDSYRNGADLIPDIEDADKAGRSWEDLPISPTVFLSSRNELYVGAGLPMSEMGEVINCVVAVGRSAAESTALNRRNPYNAPTGTTALSLTGATDAVSRIVSADYPDAKFDIWGIDIVPEDPDDICSDTHTAYVVSVSADDTKTSVGVYGVGALVPMIWKYYDEHWERCTNEPDVLQDVTRRIYEDRDNGALGAVFLYPDEYEAWSMTPSVEAEVSDSLSSCFFAFALYDDTLVSVLHGTPDENGGFDPDSVLCQATLKAGECMKIYASPRYSEREHRSRVRDILRSRHDHNFRRSR